MDTIILLLVIVGAGLVFALFITILGKVADQKKGTTSQKIGNAIGDIAHNTASVISTSARRLTETPEEKKIRMNKGVVANKNTHLFHTQYYDEDTRKRLFTIDQNLKSSLEFLGISEETWKRLAKKLFYLGILKHLAYGPAPYYRKYDKYYREHQIKEGADLNNKYRFLHLPLIEALDYYNISYQEWIDYGEVVVAMHNLAEDDDIKKYGWMYEVRPAYVPDSDE